MPSGPSELFCSIFFEHLSVIGFNKNNTSEMRHHHRRRIRSAGAAIIVCNRFCSQTRWSLFVL